MNADPESIQSIERRLAALSRAVRFAMAAVVVGLSYPNIQLGLRIGNFATIYDEMLGGKSCQR